MLVGPVVVVGTSIASQDKWCTHHEAVAVRPLPRPRPLLPTHHSMTLHATLNVILSLEYPKSVSSTLLGGSVVVVGTSIASHDM